MYWLGSPKKLTFWFFPLEPGQVIGIDMEWRPSFGTVGRKSRVSVVQMAVHGQVFLLDMLELLKHGGKDEEALSSFFQTLFADPTITKLGNTCFLLSLGFPGSLELSKCGYICLVSLLVGCANLVIRDQIVLALRFVSGEQGIHLQIHKLMSRTFSQESQWATMGLKRWDLQSHIQVRDVQRKFLWSTNHMMSSQ